MTMKTVKFTNSDAIPKFAEIKCNIEAIPLIMAWYGAFYAGDRYFVTVDGNRVQKDISGELVGEINP